MKHIVMFSGGASSSYLSWLVAQKYGKENTILLHTPTGAEHPDADRFRQEVADYIGLSMTEKSCGMDLWQLIEKENCLPSSFIPFCTRILKIEQSRKFWKSMKEDYTVHFGYGMKEWRRIQKQKIRLEVEGINSEYLIFEKNISEEEIKRTIREDWKICLPEPYKYLEHNNCIPCFKAGKGHFRRVAKYYPDYFKRAMAVEEKIGYTVFKDCTLKEIWDEVQANKNQLELFDDKEIIPCMCAN